MVAFEWGGKYDAERTAETEKLTQAECAKYLGVPLRTYQNYETDAAKRTSIKYLYMLEKLEQYGFVDEDHGILSIQKIKDVCTDVFADYDIEYCYLFGSYAKGKRQKLVM